MSNFRFVRNYVGPLQAAVLDWSGTTADMYVLAPAVAFVEVFKKQNVTISISEARGPMGTRKDMHIKSITEMPEVRKRWIAAHGREPNQQDVDNMFKDFIPTQLEVLRNYGTLLPGCAEAVNTMKKELNMKVGCSTGFFKSMSDILVEEAIKQGFTPDAAVAGDEVKNGNRPNPHMIYRNMDLMNISPIQSVVKVDDTVSGIGEGLNAGCWVVGVSRYSNYMDIDDFEHAKSLNEEDLKVRNEKSADILRKAGAHYVVDSIADLPAVCRDINQRLARGEKP